MPLLDVVDLSVMSVDKIKLLQGKLKPGARIYAETGQFLVPLKKEEKATFVDRVNERGHAGEPSRGCAPRRSHLLTPAPCLLLGPAEA